MLFAYATNGYAQNMVRGVVTDVTGDPLPGVSVVVKGTTTGTTTDIDGRYSINASNTATLEFSYIGMNKQEIKVNGRSTINIILKEDVANLDGSTAGLDGVVYYFTWNTKESSLNRICSHGISKRYVENNCQ